MKFTNMFAPELSGFKLSQRSQDRLVGVNPQLVEVTKLALDYSAVDFGVTCGLRTLEQQRLLVADGKSQTLKSKHLEGKAVDVVAYHGSKVSWELEDYVTIAEAFRIASVETGIDITWGAAWLAPLHKYRSSRLAMDEYVSLRQTQGKRPFIDGPHFQL